MLSTWVDKPTSFKGKEGGRMLSITVIDGEKVIHLDRVNKIEYENGVLVITSENRCNPNEIDTFDSDEFEAVLTKERSNDDARES